MADGGSYEPSQDLLNQALALYGLGPNAQVQPKPISLPPVPQVGPPISPGKGVNAQALAQWAADRYNNIHPSVATNTPYLATGLASSTLSAPQLKIVTGGIGGN